MEHIAIPDRIDLGREHDYDMDTLFTHYEKHLLLIKSGEQLDSFQS
jgi:hypothetical protein